jgi:RimJ/RimL family protein N-acetyltransferase
MIAPKVTLRPLRSADAEAFMTWAGDPETTRSLFWDHYADLETARAFLKRVVEPHPWFMAVCVDGAPVGSVRVLEKAGMQREAHLRRYVMHRGLIRDRYVYATIQS